jgi:hypothetical protein
MKHHIESALLLITFLTLGIFALSFVGIVTLTMENLLK